MKFRMHNKSAAKAKRTKDATAGSTSIENASATSAYTESAPTGNAGTGSSPAAPVPDPASSDASARATAPTAADGSRITTADIMVERARVEKSRRTRRATVEVLGFVAIAAAIAVLISTLMFPIFRIYGDSMEPTLDTGDVVVGSKLADMQQGDLVAFYLNNKILVKRLIAKPGDWVDIADDGTVSVNGQPLNEPYLPAGDLSKGHVNITLPYQVPDGRYFVMGDNRAESLDSRVSEVGCVATDQVVGKLELRIWPFASIGGVA